MKHSALIAWRGALTASVGLTLVCPGCGSGQSGSSSAAAGTGGTSMVGTAGAGGPGASAGSSVGGGGAAGDSGGEPGGAAGTPVAGNGGTMSAGSGGSAGSAGAGGTAPNAACGGALLGSWIAASDSHDFPPIPSDSEECQGLELSGEVAFPSFSFTLNLLAPQLHAIVLEFDSTEPAAAESGMFIMRESFEGPVTKSYPQQCLVVSDGTVECDDLGTMIAGFAMGEGWGRGAECVVGAAGGCDCTVQVFYVVAIDGDWTTSGMGNLALTRLRPMLPEDMVVNATFCVQGDSLTVEPGLGIIGFFPSLTPLTQFARLDCSDGVQGPVEEGTDCGFSSCGVPCP